MVTELQKKTAQAIVNVFETGHPLGDYGQVTLLANDSGHLTYGRAQTTLMSGNLHLLIKAYCEAPGAQLASPLSEYLERLANRNTSLDLDQQLRDLLREAGGDPAMHDVQDGFFDRVYWAPSVQAASNSGIDNALGSGVVYDSRIHGSWEKMRSLTTQQHGSPADIGEQDWISHYVDERRNWLASHANSLLHRTVYRMDAFRQLINAARWSLALPLTVRGALIDETILSSSPPVRVSAHDESERTLKLQVPYLIGSDVTTVQRALAKAGFILDADGIFGPLTDAIVRQFQLEKGLTADGIVGPATRSALDASTTISQPMAETAKAANKRSRSAAKGRK
jgi:chitosanase